MSRTKLSNVQIGKEGHIARWINESAQAYCPLCLKYLSYFDYEREDNYQLAINSLNKHMREQHDRSDY